MLISHRNSEQMALVGAAANVMVAMVSGGRCGRGREADVDQYRNLSLVGFVGADSTLPCVSDTPARVEVSPEVGSYSTPLIGRRHRYI